MSHEFNVAASGWAGPSLPHQHAPRSCWHSLNTKVHYGVFCFFFPLQNRLGNVERKLEIWKNPLSLTRCWKGIEKKCRAATVKLKCWMLRWTKIPLLCTCKALLIIGRSLCMCEVCVRAVCACVSENVCMCFNHRDRLTGNDAVGTTYLNLAKIASSGGEIEGSYCSIS